MSDVLKFNQIGAVYATFKTATVSDIAVVDEDDIGKLVTLNADGQVGIDATNTTPLGIRGVLQAVSDDGATCTVQIKGLAKVACGETVAFSGNRTYLGTYNGILYLHSSAVVTSGGSISLIEGGTTSKDAVIDLG